MQNVLRDFENFCCAYIDDILLKKKMVDLTILYKNLQQKAKGEMNKKPMQGS